MDDSMPAGMSQREANCLEILAPIIKAPLRRPRPRSAALTSHSGPIPESRHLLKAGSALRSLV